MYSVFSLFYLFEIFIYRDIRGAQEMKTFVAAVDTRRWGVCRVWMGFPVEHKSVWKRRATMWAFPILSAFLLFSSPCKSSARQNALQMCGPSGHHRTVHGPNPKRSVNRNLPRFTWDIEIVLFHCRCRHCDTPSGLTLTPAEIYSPWKALRRLIDEALVECGFAVKENFRDERDNVRLGGHAELKRGAAFGQSVRHHLYPLWRERSHNALPWNNVNMWENL